MPSPVHPYSDYGVALRTLRSARSWLAWLLAVCVVAQLIGFALMRYTEQPYWSHKPAYELDTNFSVLNRKLSATSEPATPAVVVATTAPGIAATGPSASQPVVAATTLPVTLAVGSAGTQPATTDYEPPLSPEGRRLNIRPQWNTIYVMSVAATQVGGLLAAASQTLIVFVTLLVVLVAQAPGVAHVTRALIWAVLLLFMILPWQVFARDFPIPGVLYGYQEMLRMIGPHVVGESVTGFARIEVISRFVIYPFASLFLLLMMSERFRAGLMLAIGHPLQSMMQPRPGLSNPVMTSKSNVPGSLGSEKKIG